MKTTIAILAFIGANSPMFGQIAFGAAAPVSKDDPIYHLLADHQATINAAYEKEQRNHAKFSNWVEVQTPAATRLFPQLRFASISWREQPNTASKMPRGSLADGLETTLAVNATTGKVEAILPAQGSHAYEAYGKILATHAVHLRDKDDAKTIWDAFCEIHHLYWKDRPIKKISPSEWRLGISSSDQTISVVNGSKTEVARTYYMKVAVDPITSEVISLEYKMDSSNERKTPTK